MEREMVEDEVGEMEKKRETRSGWGSREGGEGEREEGKKMRGETERQVISTQILRACRRNNSDYKISSPAKTWCLLRSKRLGNRKAARRYRSCS